MRRFLYKCDECHSISIFPVPNDDVLKEYYSNYGEGQKDTQKWPKRAVTPIIVDLSKALRKGKVLDIGCGNGSLLNLLPSSLEKYGVEIAASVISEAERKNIKVSCAPWEFAEFEGQFDLIIALDFLEHVRDPWLSFKKMADSLKPGGRLVIETGNADSLVARTLKDDWSYMAVWGHLGGLSAKALIAYSEKANIKVLKIIKGKHFKVALGRMLYRGLLAYGLRGAKLILSFLGNNKFKQNLFYNICNRVPIPAEFPDHMILIGQKNNNN
jgi:SAM-dependent methyltransferase